MSLAELYWLMVLGYLTTPLSWFVCAVAVLMLWRFAHPVGVVMLSSVAATAVLEAIATGLGFSYGSKELALLSISSHLIPALVINTILATLLFFALRKRRA